MIDFASNGHLTLRAWHRDLVGGRDVILKYASALAHLQLFNGYMHEKHIDVYAKSPGEYENVRYHIVNSFDHIDFVRIGNVLCTTASQTINDMLADYHQVDTMALVEGLSGYYFAHGESFSGLDIYPENVARFNSIKDWATEYYDEE